MACSAAKKNIPWRSKHGVFPLLMTTWSASVEMHPGCTSASTRTNTRESSKHSSFVRRRLGRVERGGGERAPRVHYLAEPLPTATRTRAVHGCKPTSDRDDGVYFRLSVIALRPLPGPEAARRARVRRSTTSRSKLSRRWRNRSTSRDVNISEYAISIFGGPGRRPRSSRGDGVDTRITCRVELSDGFVRNKAMGWSRAWRRPERCRRVGALEELAIMPQYASSRR